MLLGPEGSSAIIGVRPSTAGVSLAAALAHRKPHASSLTIAETDFGALLRIPLVRQRLPALPPSPADGPSPGISSSGDGSIIAPTPTAAADGGDMSDGSIGGGSSGDYGLGISFSPGAHAAAAPGDSPSSLRFYVLRLVAGGPAEMCGLIQVRSCACVAARKSFSLPPLSPESLTLTPAWGRARQRRRRCSCGIFVRARALRRCGFYGQRG